MPYFFFHWTPESIAHIAEHGVHREDFESIVCSSEEFSVSRSSGRLLAFGYSDDGRELVCVFEKIEDDVFPVTAYQVDD